MPEWTDKERTHYQMYQTVSEGTPVSPVFATPEGLAKWLADNEIDAGRGPATYKQWLNVARGGYAPSAVIINGQVMSGVEATEHWQRYIDTITRICYTKHMSYIVENGYQYDLTDAEAKKLKGLIYTCDEKDCATFHLHYDFLDKHRGDVNAAYDELDKILGREETHGG